MLVYDPKLFLDRLGSGDGLEPLSEEDKTLLDREVFRSTEWVQLDRGTLTDEQALESMKRRIPERLHASAKQLIEHWDEPRLPIEENCRLAERLAAAGYGVYLFTNASLRHKRYWPKQAISALFGDRIMLSSDYKILKPAAEFFEIGLEKFGLRAEECVFIDDFPLNVEAAERLGISGIVYHGDPALLEQRLKELGVVL